MGFGWAWARAGATWWSQAFGIGLLAVGVVLFVASLGRFVREGRGTLAPWDPPRRLVVRGPYRYVRNPMISGVVLALFGEAALLLSRPHLFGRSCFSESTRSTFRCSRSRCWPSASEPTTASTGGTSRDCSRGGGPGNRSHPRAMFRRASDRGPHQPEREAGGTWDVFCWVEALDTCCRGARAARGHVRLPARGPAWTERESRGPRSQRLCPGLRERSGRSGLAAPGARACRCPARILDLARVVSVRPATSIRPNTSPAASR